MVRRNYNLFKIFKTLQNKNANVQDLFIIHGTHRIVGPLDNIFLFNFKLLPITFMYSETCSIKYTTKKTQFIQLPVYTILAKKS